jgi:hypothetical protein
MAYEPGMTIIFDVISKSALVSFRGRITNLPGPFESKEAAVVAGEALCRDLGWNEIVHRYQGAT